MLALHLPRRFNFTNISRAVFSPIIVIRVFSYWHTRLYSYVCLWYFMHGLRACTLHNSETLGSLNWIRVCPSHCHECTLVCSHVLYCHDSKISKYTTFKPITRIAISYIDLPMVLALLIYLSQKLQARIVRAEKPSITISN